MVSENNKISFSPLLLIIIPLRNIKKLFKKIEANFITGILVGAIFSLVVNIITNQVGEAITRQKSLEALEIEILNHHQTNILMIDYFVKGSYKKNSNGFYTYFNHSYGDNIWRSLASTTFFYSLSPDTQAQLITYYSVLINEINPTLQSDDAAVQKYKDIYTECTLEGRQCTKEKEIYNKFVEFYTQDQAGWGGFLDRYVYKLTLVFHPTRDRLNDPLLRLLMGKQALQSLALPWKSPPK